MNSRVVGLGRYHDGLARVLPFAVYIVVLAGGPMLRRVLPAAWDARWLYAAQIAAVIVVLLWFGPTYRELRPVALNRRHALEAVAAGVAVFLLWINLDLSWAMLGTADTGFDPRSPNGGIDWGLATVRLFGAAAVVPIMEELFWRSFILRWIDDHDFVQLPPVAVSLRALLLTSIVFGVEHNLWLAGILAGLAYGGLYIRSAKLWSPILAHAVTNLLLGLWVLATASWSFW